MWGNLPKYRISKGRPYELSGFRFGQKYWIILSNEVSLEQVTRVVEAEAEKKKNIKITIKGILFEPTELTFFIYKEAEGETKEAGEEVVDLAFEFIPSSEDLTRFI